MARKRTRISQFGLEGDPDDACAYLVHHYRSCDWSLDVDGLALPEIVQEARGHASRCDGKPMPRPQVPVGPSALGPGIIEYWSGELARQLRMLQQLN